MVSHCASVEVKTLEFVKALYLCVEGEFEDFLGECAEGVIFCDEVGFAFEGSDSGEVAACACEHTALGGVTVFAFRCHSLSFLADNFDCSLDIAVSFGEGVLAIHHSCAGHVAQFFDIFYAYSHLNMVLKLLK